MTTADRSLGVFETLLVRDGAVQALGAHLARLRGSTASLYGLEPPGDLEARIRERAAALGPGEHRLRVDVRPGQPALDVTFQTGPLPPRPELFRLRPLTLAGGYGAHKLADRGPLTGTSSASGGPVALLVDADPDATVLEAGVGERLAGGLRPADHAAARRPDPAGGHARARDRARRLARSVGR